MTLFQKDIVCALKREERNGLFKSNKNQCFSQMECLLFIVYEERKKERERERERERNYKYIFNEFCILCKTFFIYKWNLYII